MEPPLGFLSMLISVILTMELIDYRILLVVRSSAFITTRKNESIEKRSIQPGHVNTVNQFSGIRYTAYNNRGVPS